MLKNKTFDFSFLHPVFHSKRSVVFLKLGACYKLQSFTSLGNNYEIFPVPNVKITNKL